MRKLLLFLLPVLAVVGCGGGDAIQVGDVQVSQDSFNRWVQTNARAISGNMDQLGGLDAPDFNNCVAAKKKAAGRTQAPSDDALRKLCQSLYKAAQQQTVNTLASQAWVLAQASKQGLHADPKQVEQQIQTLQQQFGKVDGGVNEQDLKQQAEYIILVQQLRQKAESAKPAQPSQAQLLAYYNKHLSQFSKMPSRDIMLLIAKDKQQGQAAASQLRAGKSWDSVFKRYNDLTIWGSNKPMQSGATRPSFQAGLRGMLFGAPVGKIMGPYHLAEYKNGWVVFQVKKSSPGYSAKPFSQLQGQIRQNFIFAERAQAADRAINSLQREWQPKTECDDAIKDMYPCRGTSSSSK
jgi:hypothetical protein